MSHKLFVYGTLKKDFSNHILLEQSKLIGPAYVRRMAMLNRSGYPYAYEAGPEDFVIGELYEVDDATLRDCDGLEGYPSHYDRKKINTYRLEDLFKQTHPSHSAWIYFSHHITNEQIEEYGVTRDWGRKEIRYQYPYGQNNQTRIGITEVEEK